MPPPPLVNFVIQLGNRSVFFQRPDHLLPASFFQVHVPGGTFLKVAPARGSKASSFVTVLSIWNTMMGTSLLSVPWAVGKSGLAGSLIIGFVMAAIACYTALIIVNIHRKRGKV